MVHETPEIECKMFHKTCALIFFVHFFFVGEMVHGFCYMHKVFVLLQKRQEPVLPVTKYLGNGS